MFRNRFESKFNFRNQLDRLTEPGRGVPCKWQSRYLEVKQGHTWEFPHYNYSATTNHTPLLHRSRSVPLPACTSPPRSISIAVFAFVPLVLREREMWRSCVSRALRFPSNKASIGGASIRSSQSASRNLSTGSVCVLIRYG